MLAGLAAAYTPSVNTVLDTASCVSIVSSASDDWCVSNCGAGNCPSTVCNCGDEAKAAKDTAAAPDAAAAPEAPAVPADDTLGPRPLSEAECMTQLDRLPDAVVAPSEGLIWCPTAKAGTTSILALLNRKFNGAVLRLQRAHASGNYAGWRLTGSAADECVRASSMDQAARRGFCARGTALSFSVMRSPWERVLSSYLEKVAATQVESEIWSNKGGGLVGLILHDLGLRPGATISFSQFVLWLSAKEPGSDDNIHIMPWSVRCGAVPPARYSMIGRTETLEADLHRLLGALHWDQALALHPTLNPNPSPNPKPNPDPSTKPNPRPRPKTQRQPQPQPKPTPAPNQALLPAERDNSSVDKCKADAQCRAVVEGQLGPGALDRVTSSRELLPLMFASDASHDLVELVRARYAEDVAAGSFELPSIDNSTST